MHGGGAAVRGHVGTVTWGQGRSGAARGRGRDGDKEAVDRLTEGGQSFQRGETVPEEAGRVGERG